MSGFNVYEIVTKMFERFKMGYLLYHCQKDIFAH